MAVSTNFGLALAMSDTCCNNGYKVVCISLLNPPVSMVNKAIEHGVNVLSLHNENATIRYERDLPKLGDLIAAWADADKIFFIGHDTLTGALANYLSTIQAVPAVPVVFHHMNYEAYYGIKGHAPNDTSQKVNEQRELFAASENVVAVGPKLFSSAENKLASLKRTYNLIPGVEDIPPKTAPEDLAAITFGRYDPANDRLKQIGLAARAFASFIDTAYPIGSDNRLLVIGTTEGHGAKELLTQARAGTTRFMLSYHEGFGLVGLEAIAAGVPLILTVNSGLYKFLEQELDGGSFMDWGLIPIPVQVDEDGKPSHETLTSVTKAYETFWNNKDVFKKGALALRDRLHTTYSWMQCAANFLAILKDITANQQEIHDKSAYQEKLEMVSLNSTSSSQPLIQLVYGKSNAPLVFRSRYTPLVGRENEWQTLQEFWQSPVQLAWHVLAGNAGTGKSRLALEYCIAMSKLDWYAGFLSAAELDQFEWGRWRPVWDTVLVVDHLASQSNRITTMLSDLYAVSSSWQRKVRVLLLERDAEGSWYHPFKIEVEEGKIPLPFNNGTTLLTGLNNRALMRLITTIGMAHAGPNQVILLKKLRHLDATARPLFMILSLLNIADQNAGESSRTTLLKRYLDKENAEIASTMLPSPVLQQQHKALIVLLTLTSGLSYDELQLLLAAGHPFLPQQPDERVLSRWGMIDREHQIIRGLEPDLLGEYMLLTELNNSHPFAPSLRPIAPAIIRLAWILAPEQMQAFVIRASADFPSRDVLTLIPVPDATASTNYTASWLQLVPKVIRALVETPEGLEIANSLNAILQNINLTGNTHELTAAKAYATMELLQGRVNYSAAFDPEASFDTIITLVENANSQELSTEAAYTSFRLAKRFRGRWKFDAYWNSMQFLYRLQKSDPSHLAGNFLRKLKIEHSYWAIQEQRVAQVPKTMAAPFDELLTLGAAAAVPHAIVMHTAVFTAVLRKDFATAMAAYKHFKKFAALANHPFITHHLVKAITNLMTSNHGHWQELAGILDDYHHFAMEGDAETKADHLHCWADIIGRYSVACPEGLSLRELQIEKVATSLPGDPTLEAAYGDFWEAKCKFFLRQMDENNALKVYQEIMQRFPLTSSANIDLRWQMASELSSYYRLLGDDQLANQYLEEARNTATKFGKKREFGFYSASNDFE